jgi:hypothetical protein
LGKVGAWRRVKGYVPSIDPNPSPARKKLGIGKAAATIKTVVARLDRAIQYAAASRSISNVSGILGRPVKAGR